MKTSLFFIIALFWIQATPCEPLRVVTWSGSYVKSQILGFIRPFEKETGIDVEVLQYSGGIDEIRSQVRSFNIKWDVVDFELFDAIAACNEGLLEPVDLFRACGRTACGRHLATVKTAPSWGFSIRHGFFSSAAPLGRGNGRINGCSCAHPRRLFLRGGIM